MIYASMLIHATMQFPKNENFRSFLLVFLYLAIHTIQQVGNEFVQFSKNENFENTTNLIAILLL